MEQQIQQIKLLVEHGEYMEALARIQQLPEDLQESGSVCNILGIITLALKRYEDAEAFFKTACRKEPDEPDNWLNLAYLYVLTNKLRPFSDVCRTLEQLEYRDELFDQMEEWKKEIYRARPKKNVLMIAYFFPPLGGSGAFRSLKFAKYLSEYGWQPTVIAAQKAPDTWKFLDESQLTEVPDHVRVIRVEDLAEEQAGEQMTADEIRKILEFQMSVVRHDSALMELLGGCYSDPAGFGALLQFPDQMMIWAWTVAEYIEKNLDMSQYDVLYTTAAPYSSPLLGLYLKEKYQIPWVSDYRDPLTMNPYRNLPPNSPLREIGYYFERLVLQHADLNITPAESLIPEYVSVFGLKPEQIVSVSNGYDEQNFSKLCDRTSKTEVFTITYTGLLYGDQRSMNPIFQALSELIAEHKIEKDLVQILWIGNRADNLLEGAEQYDLLDRLFLSEHYTAHESALQINMNSDLLLLLVGDEERFKHVWTGKIYDYLRAGRQILALAPANSVVKPVFDEIGYGYLTQGTEIDQIKRYLLQEYQAWLQTDGPIRYYHPSIKRFERCHLAGQLADALERAATE